MYFFETERQWDQAGQKPLLTRIGTSGQFSLMSHSNLRVTVEAKVPIYQNFPSSAYILFANISQSQAEIKDSRHPFMGGIAESHC